MKNLKNIHMGAAVKHKFDKSSMIVEQLANKIGRVHSTVNNIFKRKSIDSEMLIRLSEIFDYDFYNEVYMGKHTENFPRKIRLVFEIDETDIEKLNLPDVAYRSTES